jgi:hypothetical protein
LALIAVPAIVVRLLLGAEISGASMPLGRCRETAGCRLLTTAVPGMRQWTVTK